MSERRPVAVATIAELTLPPNGPGRTAWAPVRRHFGVGSFGVNGWTGAATGDVVIPDHDEVSGDAHRHEELYLVVSGRAEFTVDGETVDAPAGTLVYVADPASKRGATAIEAPTVVLALGGTPGRVFEPSSWERSAAAMPYFANGDNERAREILAEAHAEFPDDGNVLYNLACAEALCGRRDEALDHLTRAVELVEPARGWAQDDDDLASLRDDPRFPAPSP